VKSGKQVMGRVITMKDRRPVRIVETFQAGFQEASKQRNIIKL
jgi:hypothetical protein